MKRSRLGFQALGLCALVLGLMVIGVSAAQAEESGGLWTYRNTSTGLKLETLPNEAGVGAEVEAGTHITFLTKIAGNEIEILCTSLTVNEGKLLSGGTALGALTFHGCITKLNKVTQKACEPNAEGSHPGLIKTLKLKGTLLLHKLSNGTKDKIFIAEPDTGSNAIAHLEFSELCSIGENILLNGKLAIIDCQGEGEDHKEKHLVTEFASLTHLWVISDTVEHTARIDGSAFVFLAGGTTAGKSWAVLWN